MSSRDRSPISSRRKQSPDIPSATWGRSANSSGSRAELRQKNEQLQTHVGGRNEDQRSLNREERYELRKRLMAIVKAHQEKSRQTIHQQEEELQQREKWLQQREEGLQRQEEGLQQLEAELQQREKWLQQREEGLQRQEEGLQQLEAALQQREEGLQQRGERLQQQEEGLQQLEAELQQRAEGLQQRGERLQQREEGLQQLEAELQQREEGLQQRGERLQQREEGLQQLEAEQQLQKEGSQQVEAQLQEREEELQQRKEHLQQQEEGLQQQEEGQQQRKEHLQQQEEGLRQRKEHLQQQEEGLYYVEEPRRWELEQWKQRYERQAQEHRQTISEMEAFYKDKLSESRSALKEKEEQLRSFKDRVAQNVGLSLKTENTENMNSPVNQSRLTEMYQQLRVCTWPNLQLTCSEAQARTLVQEMFRAAAENMRRATETVYGGQASSPKVEKFRQTAQENLQLALYHSSKQDVFKAAFPNMGPESAELASECYWLGCLMALNSPPLLPRWDTAEEDSIFPLDIGRQT